MHLELETSLLGAFLSLETPIFLALLVSTGLIIYLTYYKNNQTMRNIGASKNPISALLSHGYFFDDFYGALARGITGFSEGLGRFEDSWLSRFPQLVASTVIRLANGVHTYFD